VSDRIVKDQRQDARTQVHWRVEFTAPALSQNVIHESSKLEDYSSSGACFLTMSDVRVGMQVVLHISIPVRIARPLVFRGEVVRVDENADVGRMFKAAAVRWLPTPKRGSAPGLRTAGSRTKSLSLNPEVAS
jgi:hypothetical protein